MQEVPPVNLLSKDENKIALMFDKISGQYDFLNHFFSLGIDKKWRKKCASLLIENNPQTILDIATGTGDLAITIAKKKTDALITGVDISEKMLEIAHKKIKHKKLESRIKLLKASADSLPFNDNAFDAVTIAFGVRNFNELEKCLSEIKRVLAKDGCVYIIEFSKSQNKVVQFFYNFYFGKLIPFIGNLLSGHKYAYTYLNKSAAQFPSGEHFMHILRKNGLKHVEAKLLTFGIATIYTAMK